MYKVLLVDDEVIIAEGIKRILKGFDMGFDAFRIVQDGQFALEILDEYRPDVIFTDIRMAYVDGLKFSEQVKKNPRHCHIPIVIISGYDNFEYAKTAFKYQIFDYLLKPIDKQELRDVVTKIVSELEAKQTNEKLSRRSKEQKAFLSLLRSGKDIEQSLQGLGLSTDGFSSMALLQWVIHPSDTMEVDHLRLGQEKLEPILKPHGYSMIYTCPYNEHSLLCLVGITEKEENDLYDVLRKKTLLTQPYSIYISDFISNIRSLPHIHKQIRFINKHKCFIQNNRIVTYTQIMGRTQDGPSYTNEVHAIIKGIRNNDKNAILQKISQIKSYIQSHNDLSIVYIESIYVGICIEIFRSFSHLYTDQAYFEVLDSFVNINGIIQRNHTYEDMHREVRDLILRFHTIYNQRRQSSQKGSPIGSIKWYIHENCCDVNLSLQSIANQFSISTSYLSTLFKKEVGTNLNEYVSRARIKKAIELLYNSSMSISEISNEVGYIGEKHFYAVFKKHTGFTPGKYRNYIKQKSVQKP